MATATQTPPKEEHETVECQTDAIEKIQSQDSSTQYSLGTPVTVATQTPSVDFAVSSMEFLKAHLREAKSKLPLHSAEHCDFLMQEEKRVMDILSLALKGFEYRQNMHLLKLEKQSQHELSHMSALRSRWTCRARASRATMTWPWPSRWPEPGPGLSRGSTALGPAGPCRSPG